MKSNNKKLFVLINFMLLLNFFDIYLYAQTRENSLIKSFCLNSFKEEMLKAELQYKEDIANETCECYLEEFLKMSSHQNAIKKCKFDAQEKFKSKY